jgi:hypothetical protein
MQPQIQMATIVTTLGVTGGTVTKVPLPYRGTAMLFPDVIEYLTTTGAPNTAHGIGPANKAYLRVSS